MRTIEDLLMSGLIEVSLDKTVQTVDSAVYSFCFFYEENGVKRSIRGYVQPQYANSNINSIINEKEYHAFDCSIQDYTDSMLTQIECISKRTGEKLVFKKI